MDKYEYKIRAEEIKTLISQKKYIEAAKVADTIDWTRVKSVMMLCTVSDVYKVNRRFEDAKLLLEMANERHPSGRMIIYSLCDLSIKMGEVVSAIKYYKEFEQVAPNDSGKYVLQYKLYEAQDVGLEERIAVLEELKKRDYREKWAYELAYLYHRVGLATKCVEECDELILWFGDGKYVMKAMELKTLHQPLTPSQQKKFDAYMMRKQGLNVPKELLEEQNDSNKKKKAAAGNGAAGQADSDMDIQVKTMDVGKYNTMNLQKELAESMRELMHNGSGSKEPVSIQDYRRYQEQAYSQEAYPEETYPQDAYSQGTYQEEGYTAEAYTDPGVYGQSPEQMGENGYDPAAGYDGPADYNASAAYGTAYGYDNTAGHEAAPAYTEPERAETQAPYVNRQQEEDGYENYLSQEYDGQISLVVPEEHPVEKQITGQMNIEDIMREWERMKRENEEKRLFSSFVPTKGAMKKLVQALDKLSLAAYTGNLILTGDPGADTLDLAKNIIKDVRAKDRNFSGKLAKIKGSALNSSKKEASELIEQLSGGALLIEGAGKINGESMKKLLLALNQERWGILVILMDTKRNMNKLIAANQGMSSFFNARFDLEALDNSTLVAYGCQYARMQEYAIDELGRLALHTRIEDMQTIDHVVTVRDVREIVDEAIDHANRKTPKHFVDVLFARRYDDDDMIILHEGDFI